MRNRMRNNIITYALLIGLFVMAVAYAVMTTQLNISGTVVKQGGTWDIHFANPTQTSGIDLTNLKLDSSTSLTFQADLQNYLDESVFTVDVVNGGSYDAVLNSIILQVTNGDTTDSYYSGTYTHAASGIVYKVTYADGTDIAVNDTLPADTTKKLKVSVKINDDSETWNDASLTFKLTLVYTQNTSSGGGESSGGVVDSNLASVYEVGDVVYFDPVVGTTCSSGSGTNCLKFNVVSDTANASTVSNNNSKGTVSFLNNTGEYESELVDNSGTIVTLMLSYNIADNVSWISSQTTLATYTSTWLSSLNTRMITFDELYALAQYHQSDVVSGAEIIAPATVWYAGDYWTSTLYPSDSNYAYASLIVQKDSTTYVSWGPDFNSLGGINTGFFAVTSSLFGVRPVITVTR